MNINYFSIDTLRKIIHLIGKKGIAWLVAGIVALFTLVGVEYSIAIYIQLLLAKIDLIEVEKVNTFLTPLLDLPFSTICLLLVVISVFRSVGMFFLPQSARVFSQLVNTRLRFITIYEILKSPQGNLVQSSKVHHLFGEVFPKTGQFINNTVSTIAMFLQACILSLVLIYTAPKEAAIGITGMAIVGLFIKFVQGKILGIASGVISEQFEISKSIEKICRNHLLIKIYKTENKEYNFLANRNVYFFNHIARSGMVGEFSSTLPFLFGITLVAAIIYISHEHFLTAGATLVTFLYLFLRLAQQLGNAVNCLSSSLIVFPQFKESMEYILNFNKEELEEAYRPSDELKAFKKNHSEVPFFLDHKSSQKKETVAPEIIFNNVSFSYDNNEKVFSNINLKINSNEVFGIMGKSGSGKSTLLKLLLGIETATEGEITLNSMTPKTFQDLHYSSIGYAGAKPYMTIGSVEKNLSYGNEDGFTKEELNYLLNFFDLQQLIEGNGRSVTIDENEGGLSTGQLQRLSLIRALLRKPKLLILDEATANLDEKNKHIILDKIRNLRESMTIVIVSHDPEVIKVCDNFISLEDSHQFSQAYL